MEAWTLAPGWPKELALRELRNDMIKRQLEKGQTVAYRQSGWSCYPLISSNDLCYFEPVLRHDLKVSESSALWSRGGAITRTLSRR